MCKASALCSECLDIIRLQNGGKWYYRKILEEHNSCGAERALAKVCSLALSLSLLKSVGIFNRSDCKAVWFFNALAEVISHPSHLHSCGWYTIKAEGQIPLSLHTARLLQPGS